MARNDPVTVSVEFLRHTAAAVLVRDGGEEIWLPKSKIEEDDDWDAYERDDVIGVTIPEWLAEDKGLM